MHTRHSRDVEVDSPPRFLSLEDKRSRKSRSHAADVDVSVNSNFFFHEQVETLAPNGRLLDCRSTGADNVTYRQIPQKIER